MIRLDGRSLSIDEVVKAARGGEQVSLTETAKSAVAEREDYLNALLEEGRPIYGLTTGFGALDGRIVTRDDNHAQQINLLKSHSAGVGEPMPADTVRAMMLIRANCLAAGKSGVQSVTLETLIEMLNQTVVPWVPIRGSVGACGDLAPLAHMALPAIGEGRARVQDGDWLSGSEAMQRANIDLPTLAGRDSIALINGTEQTTGIGTLAVYDARRLVRLAEEVSVLAMEALGAVSDSFDEMTALSKPHPGQIATSQRLRELSQDSVSVLAPRPSRLRDSLSLRCIPQVLGSVRDAVEYAARTIEIEINAVNDNPIFGVADGFVTSNSGNFHGQRAGEVLDYLATSLISLAVISERRSARLVDEHLNGGLSAFLIHPDAKEGVNSGMMIAQYTAASLVAELRMMSVPASIQSVPTCANTEDHVPMSPLAARRVARVVEIAFTVVTIEALLAAQAVDLRGIVPAPKLRALYDAIRTSVPTMVEDRVVGSDIETIREILSDLN